ncbi:MAG: L,D-transpeptidase [Pseudomonadota bacterium]
MTITLRSCLPLLAGLSVFAAGFSATHSAHAQESYKLAQGYYELYVDDYGREFLVDPETGEIVGRADRQRRLSRRELRRERLREQRQQRRQEQRLSRRERLERELRSLLDLDDERYEERRYEDDWERRRRANRQRNGGGFFLDERDDFEDERVAPRRERRQRDDDRRITREPLKPLPKTREQQGDEQIARLPEEQPVENSGVFRAGPAPKFNKQQMVALQVVLDRKGFSPGAIDGRWGSNVAKAVAAWRETNTSAKDITSKAGLDAALAKVGGNITTQYTITDQDVAGPFIASVPVDYARKAKLKSLAYTSPVEMLAERFHMSQNYLKALNPDVNFNMPGTIVNVVAPGPKVTRKVHYIVADKGREQVRAFDRNGALVAAYPATIGSAATPSPSGKHSVARIALDPEYTYNPKINFQQGNNTQILRIPPGPNGPVGSVWIALSKPTYGIHGTPNPETIGKTNSNGCIRLTNWDAQELASLVQKGATVEFVE